MNYARLVRSDQVHSSVFTDPRIFEDELRYIYGRTWVYVGHDSEAEKPGDYVLKSIGRHPLIMSRDEDGLVHLLINRCRHRAATVCQAEQGNSSFFRCSYHGWTYKNNGELIGVTYPNAYAQPPAAASMSLTPVPRMEIYRGFVFGSLAHEGEDLEQFLGPSRLCIDMLVNASPTGKVKLSAGVQRTMYHGNWKLIGMDGYHPNFGHKSVVNLLRRRARLQKNLATDSEQEADRRQEFSDGFEGDSANQTADLGHGHTRLITTSTWDSDYESKIEPLVRSEAGKEYARLLAESYGVDRVRKILVEARDPHIGIYPNLQIIESQVTLLRPMAVDRTEVLMWPALFDGVPDEINQERLRRHEWFYGPSSFGTADDSEMFERMQRGMQSDIDPWVLLARGAGREKELDDGTLIGHITDEVPQRGMMREWARLMTAGSSDHQRTATSQ